MFRRRKAGDGDGPRVPGSTVVGDEEDGQPGLQTAGRPPAKMVFVLSPLAQMCL